MHRVFLFNDFAILSIYSNYYDNQYKETTNNEEVQQINDPNEYASSANFYEETTDEEDQQMDDDPNEGVSGANSDGETVD